MGGGTATEEEQVGINTAAQELLLRLPGISIHNYRAVMSKVDSIAALSRLTQAEIGEIIGEANARKLYQFFHQDPGL